jgi:hypothetical protein
MPEQDFADKVAVVTGAGPTVVTPHSERGRAGNGY